MAVIYAMTAFRQKMLPFFLLLILSLGMFYLGVASLALPSTTTAGKAVAILFLHFFGTSIIPLGMLYLRMLRKQTAYKILNLLWIIVPVAQTTVTLALIALAEVKNRLLDEVFFNWTMVVYTAVIVISAIVFAWYYIHIWKQERFSLSRWKAFFRREGKLRPLEIQAAILCVAYALVLIETIIMVAIGGHHVLMSEILCLPTIILVVILGFVAMFGETKEISLSDMGRIMRYNTHTKELEKTYNPVEAGETEAENEFAGSFITAVGRSWDGNSLLSRFQHLMIDTQIFLQPRLTLGDVAELLGTNKTYISKLVNTTYNLSFPELINTLRVDYAEQYILAHRDAHQKEIAVACGFLSASSFNNTFKNVTGVTPRIWVAGWDKKHRPGGDINS